MKPQHIALVIAINLVWALNVVALKIGVQNLAPLATAFVRFAVVLLVCLPWLRWIPSKIHLIVATALVAGAGYNALNATGFSLANNVSALAIVGQLGVPFSILMAAAFLRERVEWKQWLGVLLALAGVAVITFDARIFDERLGLLLVITACAFWACGNLLFRHLKTVSVLNIHGWLALISLPCLGLASLISEPGALARIFSLPANVWGWLIFSALGSSILGHVGMSWLLQRYPVGTILPLTIPSPILAVIFSAIAFDIALTIELIIGGLITIAGIVVIISQIAKKSENATG